MRQRWSTIGPPVAVTIAGVALAGMVVTAVASGDASAVMGKPVPPIPGAVPSEAQESGEAAPTEDRDPHSFTPTMPADICSDSTTCGFAEVH